MKKLLPLLALLFYTHYAEGQNTYTITLPVQGKDSIKIQVNGKQVLGTAEETSPRLSNAYYLAKEMIRMEKKIYRDKKKLSDTDKNEIRNILGAAVWYANMQDDPSAISIILTKYEKLGGIYYKLLPQLYNLSFLDSTKEYFDTIYPNEFKELKDELNNLWLNRKKQDSIINDLYKIKKSVNTEAKKIDVSKITDSEIINTTEIEVIRNKINSVLAKYQQSEKFDTTSITSDINALDTLNNYVALTSGVCEQLKKLRDELHNLDSGINSLRNIKNEENKIKINLIYKFNSPQNLPDSLKNQIARISKLETTVWQNNITRQNELIKTTESGYAIQKEQQQTAEAQTMAYSFKLPTEAEMIDAVAIYLAKRVKQEAVMWFFETIQKNASQYDLLKTFFPNTISLLQSNEVYEIPNLGAQWRYALSKDFVRMPRNVLTSDWFNRWFDSKTNSNKNIIQFLVATYDACDLLNQQYTYSSLIKQMYLNLLEKQPNNVSQDENSLLTPATVFSILYSIDQECNIYVYPNADSAQTRPMRYEDFRNLTKDELEIMISLMDMKYNQGFSKIWKTRSLFLDSIKDAESFRIWAGKIETAIGQVNKLQAEYVKMTSEINEGKKIDAVYSGFNVWDNINNLIKAVIPDKGIANTKLSSIADKSVELKNNLVTAFEIYNQLSVKNYAGAVNTTISLVEDLLYSKNNMAEFDLKKVMALSGYHDTTSLMKKLKQEPKNKTGKQDTVSTLKIKKSVVLVTESGDTIKLRKGSFKIINDENFKNDSSKPKSSALYAVNKDTISFTQNAVYSAVIFEKERQALNLVRKLSGFLNDVMLTTDSKQLARVVESYAMPAGSYKRKRNSWWSLDLNAYVGGYWGLEKLKDGSNALSGVYGITAPIGIALSRTLGKELNPGDSLSEDLIRNPDKLRVTQKHIWKRTQTTFTLAFNIVDIGAVVSYRLSGGNSTSQGLPYEVKWEQFLSPGVQISYGIRNTPLVLSTGYQYTPKLRTLDSKEMVSTGRWYLGVLFDLPLFNLWQRSYWKSYYLK